MSRSASSNLQDAAHTIDTAGRRAYASTLDIRRHQGVAPFQRLLCHVRKEPLTYE